MEFTNEDCSTTWWYSETVIKYKSTIDTYEAYLPDHCTMVEFSSLDEDYRVVANYLALCTVISFLSIIYYTITCMQLGVHGHSYNISKQCLAHHQ